MSRIILQLCFRYNKKVFVHFPSHVPPFQHFTNYIYPRNLSELWVHWKRYENQNLLQWKEDPNFLWWVLISNMNLLAILQIGKWPIFLTLNIHNLSFLSYTFLIKQKNNHHFWNWWRWSLYVYVNYTRTRGFAILY